MTGIRRLLSPARFAASRIAARPFVVGGLALALAAAASLVGWSSIATALAQEENVRLRLREAPVSDRAFHVVYTVAVGGADQAAVHLSAALSRLDAVTERPRGVRIWHSKGATTAGVRFVESDSLALGSGRLPASECPRATCEAVALAGDFRLGQVVEVDEQTRVRVVGTGSLAPAALPDPAELGPRALFIGERDGPLVSYLASRSSTVLVTAPLDPKDVRATALAALQERLRLETVVLERAVPQLDASAPLELLGDLRNRGDVARARVLLVAGQAAALIVAFAAFAAATRRRDTSVLDEQLSTLGASRLQVWTARGVEALVPAVAAGLVALVTLFVAADRLAAARGLSSHFRAAALSPETLAAVAGTLLVAAGVLLAVTARGPRARVGLGALEIAALSAFALVVWQTTTTGGLDASAIASGHGSGPLLLLLPALASFITAVALLRLLPILLRAGERAARAAPFGLRLAFVTAARAPRQAAAATTFLAIALGAALFALNYAATLERQAGDEAAFTAGAAWRVAERAEGNVPGVELGRASVAPGDVAPSLGPARDPAVLAQTDVTPLTRYRRTTPERPTPVLRLESRLAEPGAGGGELTTEVLGVPAQRLPYLRGWRSSFSSLTLVEIAARLRPRPLHLRAPRIPEDATALRLSLRGDTAFPRIAVLHVLRRSEQHFRALRLGAVGSRWMRPTLRVPGGLRGAELVAIEFPPTYVPFGSVEDRGVIELGQLEVRRPGGWTVVSTLKGWVASRFGGSVQEPPGVGRFGRGGMQLYLQGTSLALVRPPSPLPDAVPAVVSPSVAGAATGGTITLELFGETITLRVVGVATLFPTVVARPSTFVVVDYEALFTALNLDRPGLAAPSEAWFFQPQSNGFLERLGKPPFRLERAVGEDRLEARLRTDPLAAGLRGVLDFTAIVAALLAVLGLVLATRAALASERTLFAEYEALGVPPRTLVRATQLRLLLLSLLGLGGAVAGALLAVHLIAALVSVTAAGGEPLPPVVAVIPWAADLAVVGLAAFIGVVAAALLAASTLRESAARRLRA